MQLFFFEYKTERRKMSSYEVLHASGLRRTKARETVLKLLSEARSPLSHQEIATRPEADELDRVTLYRTLATLQRAGLVHRVQGTDGSWRFCFHTQEQTACPGNHPHFLCLRCGQMDCLTGQSLPRVSVQKGARVIGKQLVVYGHCIKCASENEDDQLRRRR